jgi:hypothetical protein
VAGVWPGTDGGGDRGIDGTSTDADAEPDADEYEYADAIGHPNGDVDADGHADTK